MKEFKYIGRHADELDGGRPIAPGEYTGPIELGKEGSHNYNLHEAGLLIEVEDGTADAVQKADEAAKTQAAKDQEAAERRDTAARTSERSTENDKTGKVR